MNDQEVEVIDTITATDGRKGETYRRHDNRFDFRVFSKNGDILSNSNQGYENELDARHARDLDMGIIEQ
jgi:uncharacterized protein YegP (UPF0339 family)